MGVIDLPEATLLFGGAGAQEVWLPSPLCTVQYGFSSSSEFPWLRTLPFLWGLQGEHSYESRFIVWIPEDTLSSVVTAVELSGHPVPPSLWFQGRFSPFALCQAGRVLACGLTCAWTWDESPGDGRQHTHSTGGMWAAGGRRPEWI